MSQKPKTRFLEKIANQGGTFSIVSPKSSIKPPTTSNNYLVSSTGSQIEKPKTDFDGNKDLGSLVNSRQHQSLIKVQKSGLTQYSTVNNQKQTNQENYNSRQNKLEILATDQQNKGKSTKTLHQQSLHSLNLLNKANKKPQQSQSPNNTLSTNMKQDGMLQHFQTHQAASTRQQKQMTIKRTDLSKNAKNTTLGSLRITASSQEDNSHNLQHQAARADNNEGRSHSIQSSKRSVQNYQNALQTNKKLSNHNGKMFEKKKNSMKVISPSAGVSSGRRLAGMRKKSQGSSQDKKTEKQTVFTQESASMQYLEKPAYAGQSQQISNGRISAQSGTSESLAHLQLRGLENSQSGILLGHPTMILPLPHSVCDTRPSAKSRTSLQRSSPRKSTKAQLLNDTVKHLGQKTVDQIAFKGSSSVIGGANSGIIPGFNKQQIVTTTRSILRTPGLSISKQAQNGNNDQLFKDFTYYKTGAEDGQKKGSVVLDQQSIGPGGGGRAGILTAVGATNTSSLGQYTFNANLSAVEQRGEEPGTATMTTTTGQQQLLPDQRKNKQTRFVDQESGIIVMPQSSQSQIEESEEKLSMKQKQKRTAAYTGGKGQQSQEQLSKQKQSVKESNGTLEQALDKSETLMPNMLQKNESLREIGKGQFGEIMISKDKSTLKKKLVTGESPRNKRKQGRSKDKKFEIFQSESQLDFFQEEPIATAETDIRNNESGNGLDQGSEYKDVTNSQTNSTQKQVQSRQSTPIKIDTQHFGEALSPMHGLSRRNTGNADFLSEDLRDRNNTLQNARSIGQQPRKLTMNLKTQKSGDDSEHMENIQLKKQAKSQFGFKHHTMMSNDQLRVPPSAAAGQMRGGFQSVANHQAMLRTELEPIESTQDNFEIDLTTGTIMNKSQKSTKKGKKFGDASSRGGATVMSEGEQTVMNLLRWQSKKEDLQPMVMGQARVFCNLFPTQKVLTKNLMELTAIIIKIQRAVRRQQKAKRMRKHWMFLNMASMWVLFYKQKVEERRNLGLLPQQKAEVKGQDAKMDAEEKKRQITEKYTKTLKLKNRILVFNSGNFRIDTLDRDIKWATERKQFSKTQLDGIIKIRKLKQDLIKKHKQRLDRKQFGGEIVFQGASTSSQTLPSNTTNQQQMLQQSCQDDTSKEYQLNQMNLQNSAEKGSKGSTKGKDLNQDQNALAEKKSELSTTDQTDKNNENNMQVEKQVICIKKSDFHTPWFDPNVYDDTYSSQKVVKNGDGQIVEGPQQQNASSNFLKRQKEMLTSRESWLFHFVRLGNRERIVKHHPDFTKEEINKRDKHGNSTLMVAVLHDHVDVAKCLLKMGAEINAKFGDLGNTPLHKAFERGVEGMIEVLLENGANCNALNKDLQTPVAFASEEFKWKFYLDKCTSQTLTLKDFVQKEKPLSATYSHKQIKNSQHNSFALNQQSQRSGQNSSKSMHFQQRQQLQSNNLLPSIQSGTSKRRRRNYYNLAGSDNNIKLTYDQQERLGIQDVKMPQSLVLMKESSRHQRRGGSQLYPSIQSYSTKATLSPNLRQMFV